MSSFTTVLNDLVAKLNDRTIGKPTVETPPCPNAAGTGLHPSLPLPSFDDTNPLAWLTRATQFFLLQQTPVMQHDHLALSGPSLPLDPITHQLLIRSSEAIPCYLRTPLPRRYCLVLARTQPLTTMRHCNRHDSRDPYRITWLCLKSVSPKHPMFSIISMWALFSVVSNLIFGCRIRIRVSLAIPMQFRWPSGLISCPHKFEAPIARLSMIILLLNTPRPYQPAPMPSHVPICRFLRALFLFRLLQRLFHLWDPAFHVNFAP